MKREFLQLAHNYDAKKHGIAGWFLSEKLDGMRALWDGGITRYHGTREIPWANTTKDKHETIATGLWSRYGKPIYAPDWWLDCLPPFPLDGELYLGRQSFQRLISITKRTVNINETEWLSVKYYVFDAPSYEEIFIPGEIKNPNFNKVITADVLKWVQSRLLIMLPSGSFLARYQMLESELNKNKVAVLHNQLQLPHSTPKAQDVLDRKLLEVSKAGGEGLMLRSPVMPWFPKRCDNILKIKPLKDAEAYVVGYRCGKGKLLGLMGSLIVKFNNIEFDLSGFTDQERTLSDQDWCRQHPGEIVPIEIYSTYFPRGSQVTFTYRELTDDGVPKEGRFLRY